MFWIHIVGSRNTGPFEVGDSSREIQRIIVSSWISELHRSEHKRFNLKTVLTLHDILKIVIKEMYSNLESV